MQRSGPVAFFKQSLKSDAFHADELINIYLLRPIAAMVVWVLYPTRVTPNEVTMFAILLGIAAAAAYTLNTPAAIFIGGILVTAKDVFDDADGQLARAKGLYSRRGRFLDSIGDFVVDLLLFSAITFAVYQSYPDAATICLGVLSFLGITLRVSYHVFYQVSYLHTENNYKLNRITEGITEEDLRGDPVALRLQVVFNFIYTWQDNMMCSIDAWCMGGVVPEHKTAAWYSDKLALRLSGLLGFGTEFAVLTIFSLFNKLYLYLWLNVLVMNGIWLLAILHRRLVVRRKFSRHRTA